MAIHYRCPKCQTADSAGDDLAGTQIRCKQCGALLQLPGTRPSSPHVTETPGVPPPLPPTAEPRAQRRRDVDEDDDYDDDYPRRRRDRDDDFGAPHGEPPAGWNTVRTGLGMMFWSLIALVIEAVLMLIVLVATAGFVAGGAMRGQFRGPREDSMAAIVIVGACSMLVTYLVYFIGQCLCCAAPAHSGARGYAVGSVICIALAVVMSVLFNLLAAGMAQGGNPMLFMPGEMQGAAAAFSLVNLALSITGAILFFVFLRTVARYFGDQGLARGVMGLMILFIIWIALYAGFIFLFIALLARPGFAGGGANAEPLFLVSACVLVVMGLAVFIWYLVVLAQTRGTIGRSLARPGY